MRSGTMVQPGETIGCIGCKGCTRRADPMEMEGNLPMIDYDRYDEYKYDGWDEESAVDESSDVVTSEATVTDEEECEPYESYDYDS